MNGPYALNVSSLLLEHESDLRRVPDTLVYFKVNFIHSFNGSHSVMQGGGDQHK